MKNYPGRPWDRLMGLLAIVGLILAVMGIYGLEANQLLANWLLVILGGMILIFSGLAH